MVLTVYSSKAKRDEAAKHMYTRRTLTAEYEYQDYDFDDGANEMMEKTLFMTMFNVLIFLCAVIASCFMNFFWKHQ